MLNWMKGDGWSTGCAMRKNCNSTMLPSCFERVPRERDSDAGDAAGKRVGLDLKSRFLQTSGEI